MTNAKKDRKQREFLLKTYGKRYERHWSGRPGCFYCGDKWLELDHCPPLSWCEAKEHKWFKERKIGFYLVNSCSDCNRMLSNRALFTLQERAEFIRIRLERKTEKIVIWSNDEIKEMSERFQKTIKARQQMQNTLLDRLRYSQEMQYRADDFPL
jgi:hypothetical protein